MTLDPLAFPKGVKLECELCNTPARIQCNACRVTYYCCQEHQAVDWEGIHHSICLQLKILREPAPFLPSKEERQKKQDEVLKLKTELMELTRVMGQAVLYEGQYHKAVPAAMQYLRFAGEIYGTASLQLVPAFLLLGQASIGLQKLREAEEYLAQARWTLLKSPSASSAIKHGLYRQLGLLHSARGERAEALRNFADDIYHASKVYGTDDINTSGGYFHMANIFLTQKKPQPAIAHSLYTQVTQTWHTHLQRIFKSRIHVPPAPPGVGPGAVQPVKPQERGLDKAQEAEAIKVLNTIYQFREDQKESSCKDHVLILHALAMLHFLMDNRQKSRQFAEKALALVDSHSCTAEYQQLVHFTQVLYQPK